MSRKVSLHVMVRPETAEALRAVAKTNGRNVSEVVRRALEDATCTHESILFTKAAVGPVTGDAPLSDPGGLLVRPLRKKVRA